MPFVKGRTKTGGRQKGTLNQRPRALREAAREKIALALGEDAFDGLAIDFLQLIYRDSSQPLPLRLDAAKTAIGYETPRLNAVDARVQLASARRGGALGQRDACARLGVR